MVHLIRAFASIVIVAVIGYALVLFIFRTKSTRSVGLNFVLSLGLGFGFLAECCLICLALAGRMNFRLVYVAFVLAIAGILYKKGWAGFSRFLRLHPLRELLAERGKSGRHLSEQLLAGAGISIIAVIVIVVSFNLLARPMHQFDSRAIWGMKAKVLFHERTIFSEAIVNASSNHPHPRYPLLLPIAEGWVFENMGQADDRVVRLLFLWFFIGLILCTYELQRRLAGKMAALWCVCALLVTPFLYSGLTEGGASSGYADVIASFYITTSALAMILWLKEGDWAFALVGAILAACVALTKNEGLVFAANLFLTTAVFSLVGKGRREPGNRVKSKLAARLSGNSARLYCLALYVLIVAVMLLPWFYVRSDLPKFFDENYAQYLNYRDIAAGMHRLPQILKTFAAELLDFKVWGVIWILIAFSLGGIGRTWRRNAYFILTLMALQLASYLAVFIITPNELAGQLSSALSRLLLHILPLGVTLVSFQLVGSGSSLRPDDKENREEKPQAAK